MKCTRAHFTHALIVVSTIFLSLTGEARADEEGEWFPYADTWDDNIYATPSRWWSLHARAGFGQMEGPSEILRQTTLSGLDLQIGGMFHLEHWAVVSVDAGYFSAAASAADHVDGWGKFDVTQVSLSTSLAWKAWASKHLEARLGPRFGLISDSSSAASGVRRANGFFTRESQAWNGGKVNAGAELSLLFFPVDAFEVGLTTQFGLVTGFGPVWNRDKPSGDYDTPNSATTARLSALLGCGFHL